MHMLKKINKGVGVATTAIIIAGANPQVIQAITNNNSTVLEAKSESKEIEKTKQQNLLEKIKINVLKLNKDEPSMAGTYIQNEAIYTKKDEKTYCELKILASDWMNNIKVEIDNNEVKYELKDIGETEISGVKHKGAIIKFEVPKMNSNIKLHMFVVPMNSEVAFRIVEDNNKQSEKVVSTKEKTKIKTEETDNIEMKNKSKEKVLDKLEDGIYTLTFRAYKIENPSEDSMLNNFFDKKIKLEVIKGKKIITMLNTCFADGLYDFRIETNKIFNESKANNYGKKNPDTEKYHYKSFKIEIDNLDDDHMGCVLAGPMGGKLSDYGNVSYDKANNYKTVMFTFNKEYKKGWNGFDVDKTMLKENNNGTLNKALLEVGLDTNKDGIISNKELEEAKGPIKLVSKKIVDISQLRDLGPNVSELDLTANRIEELPKGIFDNLSQITSLKLAVNKLNTLPEGIFDKLANLKKLDLERNKLETLPKGIFDKLTKLETLLLATNNIKHLDKDIFKNNRNLTFLDFSENKVDSIPVSIEYLKKLNSLNVKNNRITIIPNELSELKNLTWLNLGSNYIEEIPQSVCNNLKNLDKFILTENMLKEVPDNIFNIFPKVKSFDLRLNNLCKIPDVPEGVKKVIYKYPQKTPTELVLKVKNGDITWSEKLTSLDIMAWQRTVKTIWKEKMPENVDEYKKHLNNKTALELLNKEGYEPREIIKIQKKDKDGRFKTIKEIILSENTNFEKSFKDPQMKIGDEYRILKELRSVFYGDDKYIFTNVANAKVEVDHKDNIEKSNTSSHDDKKEKVKDNTTKPKLDIKENKENKNAPQHKINIQNKNKVSNAQNTVDTEKVKNTSKNSNKFSIKESKLPQTGMAFGSELVALVGSAISGIGLIFVSKNKKKR